jgi:hypothetical protein
MGHLRFGGREVELVVVHAALPDVPGAHLQRGFLRQFVEVGDSLSNLGKGQLFNLGKVG